MTFITFFEHGKTYPIFIYLSMFTVVCLTNEWFVLHDPQGLSTGIRPSAFPYWAPFVGMQSNMVIICASIIP